MSDSAYYLFGGTGGIGSALARRLAARNLPIHLLARKEDTLSALANTLPLATTRICDVCDSASVQAAFEEGPTPLGVVHMVGSIILKPAHLMTDSDWDDTLRLNLTSAFYVLRAAIRKMGATPCPLVFCSSVAAKVGLSNHEAIAAAKAGLAGLVQAAAATYAAKRIRVNAVAPGLVDTPLATRITSNETALKASESMHPLGRIGQPDEIARVLEWLVTEESGWVTGQVISIDGGLSQIRSPQRV